MFLILLLTLAASQDLISSFVLVNVGSSSSYHPLFKNEWADWDVSGPFELTGAGMREQYLLGKELKRRYTESKLLSDDDLYNQVMIRSVDHNNIIESAISFLRGFVPDYTKSLNEKEINVSVPEIKVHKKFISDLGNNMLPNKMNTLPFHTYYPHQEDLFDSCSCPKANNLINSSFFDDSKVKEIINKYEKPFLDIIKEAYGIEEKPESRNYIKILESVITLMNQHKPTKLNETDDKLVKDFFEELYYYLKAGNEQANSYRAIPILGFIWNIFNATLGLAAEKETIKAGFSFINDEMFASFLYYVTGEEVRKIEPSSIITIDLYKDNIVKLKYNDREKKIKDCGDNCDFKKFTEVVEKFKKELGDVKDKCKA